MPSKGIDRYLVKPGSKFEMASVDTSEKTLWEDLTKDDHEATYDMLRDELQHLQKVLYAQQKHRVLVVIQAMDTGGKDGCIKHVFSRIDPQGINVHSFKKPSEEELAHDFLWRVHPHVPRNGQLVIFNRSHYEDILAVRVKKLFPDEVWKRRYRHVVEFERMLAEEGTTIIKIFLHISKDEQKKRLEARLENPAKHWKFNPDDLQDRARWGDFMHAYEDLIGKTSTECAPWYVIPADRKWYRNLCVANLMVEKLRSLKMEFPHPTWDPATVRVED
ncbi:polyphosphate kinase 2 family protein [Luteolibacter ambystomatis]|uniref:Polyphosphate kinase 2 family protein n=1 Tax=Luteolibacter ambystomatis TaxID=2824561 RepID=A0A975J1H7_9BACT|nr:polyphosphate kinase 2 family protein [Luteolibacter ambystomatis]QUE52306.1 polyphosphate kinase 2 family protein [Luteolibacter ambystomatis]